jgi:molybdopterin adenylyltransferase
MSSVYYDTSKEHKKNTNNSYNFAFLTISDSRDKENDNTYINSKSIIEKAGHKIIEYEIIKDNADKISQKIKEIIINSNVDIIITSGGTGITKKDVTIEAVKPLFEKELISFNTLFTNLSYGEIRTSAILSRATAGIINRKILFCLPGSPRAVKLALEKIILKEIGHLKKHIGE